MITKHITLTTVLAGSVLAATVWILGKHHQETKENDDADKIEVSAQTTLSKATAGLEKRIIELQAIPGLDSSQLKSEIDKIKKQISDIQGVLARLDRARGQSSRDTTVDAVEQARQDDLRVRDNFVYLNEVLRSEPADPAWSQTAKASIEAALGQLGKDSPVSLQSAECRSSLCKVNLNSTTDFNGFTVPMGLSSSFSGGILTSDGKQAQMFLTRSGTALPTLTP